ncbi:aldose 1-epimerase family protein YeaD [Klebsiella pneumoniae]|nr:aldose 1-epimerase family protein YeaD [Klebsiella pneumoniae]
MINKIFALPVNETISPVISRRQLDDLELIVIDHPQVKASVALQGAHLLSWKPAGEEEVLWLSNNTPFKQGVALRGGVPICWPWFGPSAQQGLPSHGFARNLPWTLEGHDEDDSGVMLTFALQHSAETMKLWPHEFTLYARFKLGKTCEIELEAHGEFETTSALHSYFNVGDIAAVKVSGLGERYIDKVNNAEEGVLSNGVQTFPDRTDRVYLNADSCSVIHDDALNRTIDVVHHHQHNVVAWNPGPALSVSMGDMPDDGYKTFVCVETCCVTQPQKASEETPSRLAQTISVKNANSKSPVGNGAFAFLCRERWVKPYPAGFFAAAADRGGPAARALPH